VVRNGHTGVVEHHEIAVKFYLGYLQPGSAADNQDVCWYGPNAFTHLRSA